MSTSVNLNQDDSARIVRGRVVVVGAINVDFIVKADALPKPGETVVGDDLVVSGGGKGANAAVAAARAGADVILIGAVGADSAGDDAREDLRREGVDVSHLLVVPSAATGSALIVVSSDGENQIAVAKGANSVLTGEQVSSAMAEVVRSAGCVLVSTEIPEAAVRAAIESAVRAGVPCILNPAPALPWVADVLAQYAVWLTPNRRECTELVRLLGARDSDDPIAAARFLRQLTSRPVVATLGSEGVHAVEADGESFDTPALRVVATDTTGAGDAFNGVFAAGVASGLDLAQAVGMAVEAASRSVQLTGARTS